MSDTTASIRTTTPYGIEIDDLAPMLNAVLDSWACELDNFDGFRRFWFAVYDYGLCVEGEHINRWGRYVPFSVYIAGDEEEFRDLYDLHDL